MAKRTYRVYSPRMTNEVTRIARSVGVRPSELLDVERDSKLRTKLGRPIEPEDYPWALDELTAFGSELENRRRKDR